METIQERWGKTTTIKDWGPDVLDLVSDPQNSDPWVDVDGPSFSKVDDELGTAKVARDSL